jgi:hypothetical protein
VADPELTMLPGLIAPQVKPEGTASVRVTVPEKPLRAVTVKVTGPLEPTLTWTDGDDVRLKSTTLIAIVNG